MLILYVPMANEVADYRQSRKWSDDEVYIRDLVQQQGSRFLSLAPVLAASSESADKLRIPVDGHWAALDHAVVA